MANSAHLIGRLDVIADISDVDLAYALRPRIETLAWNLMPRVMERVFDVLIPEGMHLRLHRLDLDLGRLRPGHLEEDAMRALETALVDALVRAIRKARETPSEDACLLTTPEWTLTRLETYLTTGTTPYTRPTDLFDVQTSLIELVEGHTGALVTMLRRRARDRYVLERLVLRLDEFGMSRLLASLAPADAATVLAILGDIMVLHVTEPPPPLRRLAKSWLNRLLLVTTLEFLLYDAGNQFNRRQFLNFLLSREAMLAGIEYDDLLDFLAVAVDRSAARFGLRSSLPLVLAELLGERRRERGQRSGASWGDGMLTAPEDLTPAQFAADMQMAAPRRETSIRADTDPRDSSGSGGPTEQDSVRSVPPNLYLMPDQLAASDQKSVKWQNESADVINGLDQTVGSNLDKMDQGFASQEGAAAGIELLTYWSDEKIFAGLVRRLRPTDAAAIQNDFATLVANQVPTIDDGDAFAALTRAFALRFLLRFCNDFRADQHAFRQYMIYNLAQSHHVNRNLDPLGSLQPSPPQGEKSGGLRSGGDDQIKALVGTQQPAGSADLLGESLWTDVPRMLSAIARPDEQNKLSATAGRTQREPWANPVSALLGAVTATGEHAAASDTEWLSDPDGPPLTPDELIRRVAPTTTAAIHAALDDLSAEFLAGAPSFDPLTVRRYIQTRLARMLKAPGRSTIIPGTGSSRRMPADRDNEIPASSGATAWQDGNSLHHLDQALRFLRTGQPRDGGHSLSGIFASNPDWLADTIRTIVKDTPGAEPILTERLLEWLLPVEILALLAPAHAEAARSRIEGIAGGDQTAWRSVVATLLRNSPPPQLPEAPGLGAWLDRLDRMQRWLDQSVDAEPMKDAVPLSGLLELSLAELSVVFLAESPEQTLARIVRAIESLDQSDQIQLLTRLAPWATRSRGPLAALLAPLNGPRRRDVLLRAAVAAVAGTEVDFTALSKPVVAHKNPSEPTNNTAPPTSLPSDNATPNAPLGAMLHDPADQAQLRHKQPDHRAEADEPAFAAGVSAEPDAEGSSPADLTDVSNGANAEAAESAALFAWLDGGPADARQTAQLVATFKTLADAGDSALATYVAANRGRPRARARWAALLPRAAMGRLVRLLVPDGARALLDSSMLIGTAWRQIAPFGARKPTESELNALLLEQIAAPGPTDPAAVIAALMRTLTKEDATQSARLQAGSIRLAQAGGYVSVAVALRRAARLQPQPAGTRSTSPPTPERSAAPPYSSGQRQGAPATPPPEPNHNLFVGNAGLVLLNPFLPTLFDRLGVLTQDEAGRQRIEGLETASRAVHLLQYLVDGRLDRGEPELVLNKLLCGLPTALPVLRAIEPSREDLAICDGLLRAVIDNWPVLRNTSPEGLQETFLMREGRLRHGDAKWTLRVQRKTLDVLTDQIPWSFAVVYHSWMTDPIHVTW
ncbi:MAG: contractile injection system tape measure protein [Acetobacteraceae bacterium]